MRIITSKNTSAYGTALYQGADGQYATGGRRRGKQVRRREEKRMTKRTGIQVGPLNAGIMTGKGRKLAYMMERKMPDILCVQGSKRKGRKARLIEGGLKLFDHGVDGRKNVIGVVVKGKYINSVMNVNRMSDRLSVLRWKLRVSY